MSATALYRHFGEHDVLLYIGVSCDLGARWARHRQRTAWVPLVRRSTVEWFVLRVDALRAERVAIATERPVHNVLGTGVPQRRAARRCPPAPQPERVGLLTYSDVGDRLSVSRTTVERMVADGRLPTVDLRRPDAARATRRIREEDLEQFLATAASPS